MAVVKNRLLLMLYLLDNSDQPLQARQLAAMAGVSERTVKNDMAELRELAQASGVEILTRQQTKSRMACRFFRATERSALYIKGGDLCEQMGYAYT